MSDVVVFSAPQDAHAARKLERGLTNAGTQVWKDNRSAPKLAVLVMSPAAARDPVLMSRASEWARTGSLVVAVVEPTPLPPTLQGASQVNLAGWRSTGEPAPPAFTRIVAERLGATYRSMGSAPPPPAPVQWMPMASQPPMGADDPGRRQRRELQCGCILIIVLFVMMLIGVTLVGVGIAL
jgi:hypothetical protein